MFNEIKVQIEYGSEHIWCFPVGFLYLLSHLIL